MTHICDFSEICGLPLLTAFLLGLVAAINPCQLAIHVSALTYLYERDDTWTKGLIYLLGRFAAFFLIGWLCVLLNSQLATLNFEWVEILLPYILLAVSIFFFYRAFHHHKHDGSCHNSSFVIHRGRRFGPFWLGVILAFLFCPESALIFFGMMVPLGVTSSPSWSVPLVFSLSSLIPFFLLLWMMRRATALISQYEARIAQAQVWVNASMGLLFLLFAISIWLLG